jgi:hypothetical protein
MKDISFFNEKDSYVLNKLTFMKNALTDTDILELQEKFLSNGLHHITVPTIADGRTLIFTFLNSLSLFLNTPACVTASDLLLPSTIINVYEQLTQQEYFNKADIGYMHTFFFEQFYCDFIWVEMTSSLVNLNWYVEFEHIFLDLHIAKDIPMLVINYENDHTIKSNLL